MFLPILLWYVDLLYTPAKNTSFCLYAETVDLVVSLLGWDWHHTLSPYRAPQSLRGDTVCLEIFVANCLLESGKSPGSLFPAGCWHSRPTVLVHLQPSPPAELPQGTVAWLCLCFYSVRGRHGHLLPYVKLFCFFFSWEIHTR